MVELALTLPMFMMLVFTVIDIGRGVYAYVAMTNAARQSGRAAVIYLEGLQVASGSSPSQSQWNGLLQSAIAAARPDMPIVPVDTSGTASLSTDSGSVMSVYNTNFSVTGLPDLYDSTSGSYDLTTLRVSINYTFHPLLTTFLPIISLPLQATSSTTYPLD